MDLNYSTAKTIVFICRKKLKLHQNKSKEDSERVTSAESDSRGLQASFRPGKQVLEISSSVGGNATYGAVKVCTFRQRTSADQTRPFKSHHDSVSFGINISTLYDSHSPFPIYSPHWSAWTLGARLFVELTLKFLLVIIPNNDVIRKIKRKKQLIQAFCSIA